MSIGAISSSTAIRVIRPVHQTRGEGPFHRDQTYAPRPAYATAGARSGGRTQAGDYAPFIAQTFPDDSSASMSSVQGAIAYLVTRDRTTDLPAGFLVAKTV